jgi:hypothetical protein
MNRDEQPIFYAKKLNKPTTVGQGPFAKSSSYSAPEKVYMDVSSGKGSAEDDVFGKDVDYSRTISTHNTDIQINQYSLIWIENQPTYNTDGTLNEESADYKVVARPAKSKNSIIIALKNTASNS